MQSLVLLVGTGRPADPDLDEVLARSGIRLVSVPAAQAAGAAAHAHFDAVVLRVDQPMAVAARGFDRWRGLFRCPLLVLSDGADEIDEIMALELGADAVLGAPVSPRRLRAHVLSLLRRTRSALAAPEPVAPAAGVSGWLLDRVCNRLCRDARQVDLTALQAALLQALMEELGRVVPRAQLQAAAAGGRELHVRSIDVYVARLRLRLRQARVDDLRIEGVRGRGYRLVALPPAGPPNGHSLQRWLAPGADTGSAQRAPALA